MNRPLPIGRDISVGSRVAAVLRSIAGGGGPAHGFARRIAVLVGGTGAAQGIALLAAPVLTRLYMPGDYGILSVYVSLSSILLAIAALRFELAVPLAPDDRTAAGVTVLSLVTVGLLSTVTLVLFWLGGDAIATAVNISRLRGFLWLVPFTVLGGGVYQVLSCWAIRQGAYASLAATRVAQSIGQVATQVVFGLILAGPVGLIVGDAVGRAGGSGSLALRAWRQTGGLFRSVTAADLWRAAVRYRTFPLLSSGSALLNSAGVYGPPLLITALYGAQVGGWFALAQRMVALPLGLLGNSVAQVYLSEASRLIQTEPARLGRVIQQTAMALLFTGAIPALALLAFGPALFSVAFGDEWRMAGEYGRLLSIMLLAQFVVVPLSQTLNILERQDLQLFWDLCRVALVLGTVLLVYQHGGAPDIAVASYSIAMLAMYVGLFWLIRIAVRAWSERVADTWAETAHLTNHGEDAFPGVLPQ